MKLILSLPIDVHHRLVHFRTAPLAALEAIGNKVPDLVNAVKAHVPHSSSIGTNTSSSSSSTARGGAEGSSETLLSQAQQLANQATQYASSGVHQLIEKLPENISSHLPEQIKNLGSEPVQLEKAATGEQAFDFTQTHTTANFEASGESRRAYECFQGPMLL